MPTFCSEKKKLFEVFSKNNNLLPFAQNVAKISKTEKLQATFFSTAEFRHHMTFTMIACCHKCLKHYLEQKIRVLASLWAS